MKKVQFSFINFAVFVIIIILCFPLQSSGAEKIKLIMCWESWEPFCYKDDKNQLIGLDIEIVTHIFNNSGYSVEYREAPWSRQLKWLEEGEIHIGASAMKTPEREAFAYFSKPYQKETYIMFVRKGESSKYKLKNLQDIIGSSFQFGVMRASLYGDEFYRLMKNPKFLEHVEEIATDELNHKKLLAKRFDGFIQEYSRIVTDGRKSGIFEKVEPLFVVEENKLHVMFSKKSTTPENVNAFNSGLKKIREDGTYQKIFRKYNLEKYNMISIGEKTD
ncbi:MAG: amino acid ABC transporter substrate-binding protein [Desulfamplus sp.]|nr:amino acid ABC transporter substrate-binding protein [Desulfamplus sp.]